MGPLASAKSLFLLQIEKFMRSKVYVAEGGCNNKRRDAKIHCRKSAQGDYQNR
jgi:hypothetical protein